LGSRPWNLPFQYKIDSTLRINGECGLRLPGVPDRMVTEHRNRIEHGHTNMRAIWPPPQADQRGIGATF